MKYYKTYIDFYKGFSKIHRQRVESVKNALNITDNKLSEIDEIIFSDSIILYSKEWSSLLYHVADVMNCLMELGFWFRGGIGYGKYYSEMSDSCISMVSEGLVEAVELEEKKAIYPRIILSPKVVSKIYNEARELHQVA